MGIKVNIEMFYLMDEMYRQDGKKIHITIGKPIPYPLLTQKHNDQEWAQKIKLHIYNLAEGKDEFEA